MSARTTVPRISIPYIEPKGSVVSEHARDFAENLYQILDILNRRIFTTDLGIVVVVSKAPVWR